MNGLLNFFEHIKSNNQINNFNGINLLNLYNSVNKDDYYSLLFLINQLLTSSNTYVVNNIIRNHEICLSPHINSFDIENIIQTFGNILYLNIHKTNLNDECMIKYILEFKSEKNIYKSLKCIKYTQNTQSYIELIKLISQFKNNKLIKKILTNDRNQYLFNSVLKKINQDEFLNIIQNSSEFFLLKFSKKYRSSIQDKLSEISKNDIFNMMHQLNKNVSTKLINIFLNIFNMEDIVRYIIENKNYDILRGYNNNSILISEICNSHDTKLIKYLYKNNTLFTSNDILRIVRKNNKKSISKIFNDNILFKLNDDDIIEIFTNNVDKLKIEWIDELIKLNHIIIKSIPINILLNFFIKNIDIFDTYVEIKILKYEFRTTLLKFVNLEIEKKEYLKICLKIAFYCNEFVIVDFLLKNDVNIDILSYRVLEKIQYSKELIDIVNKYGGWKNNTKYILFLLQNNYDLLNYFLEKNNNFTLSFDELIKYANNDVKKLQILLNNNYNVYPFIEKMINYCINHTDNTEYFQYLILLNVNIIEENDQYLVDCVKLNKFNFVNILLKYNVDIHCRSNKLFKISMENENGGILNLLIKNVKNHDKLLIGSEFYSSKLKTILKINEINNIDVKLNFEKSKNMIQNIFEKNISDFINSKCEINEIILFLENYPFLYLSQEKHQEIINKLSGNTIPSLLRLLQSKII